MDRCQNVCHKSVLTALPAKMWLIKWFDLVMKPASAPFSPSCLTEEIKHPPLWWGRSFWVWLEKLWPGSLWGALSPPPAPSQPPARWDPAAAPPVGLSCRPDNPDGGQLKYMTASSVYPRSCPIDEVNVWVMADSPHLEALVGQGSSVEGLLIVRFHF